MPDTLGINEAQQKMLNRMQYSGFKDGEYDPNFTGGYSQHLYGGKILSADASLSNNLSDFNPEADTIWHWDSDLHQRNFDHALNRKFIIILNSQGGIAGTLETHRNIPDTPLGAA